MLHLKGIFTVQLSHPYMTTGKTIALTRRTLVGKVMSLLLNMLSRLVITFLPRSKRLLISWLLSPSAVILEPSKIKSATVSPSISHEGMWPDALIFVFWMLSFKPTFHSLLSLSSRGFLVPLHFCHNQIPYDYTVEVRDRFKGLDMIDRVPEKWSYNSIDKLKLIELYTQKGWILWYINCI